MCEPNVLANENVPGPPENRNTKSELIVAVGLARDKFIVSMTTDVLVSLQPNEFHSGSKFQDQKENVRSRTFDENQSGEPQNPRSEKHRVLLCFP